jgi:hypothetical protein
MWFDGWMCLSTPQQETNVARPRPVFRAPRVFTPPGIGYARLATLAFAAPHPGGVKTERRKTNYRQQYAPTTIVAGNPKNGNICWKDTSGKTLNKIETNKLSGNK